MQFQIAVESLLLGVARPEKSSERFESTAFTLSHWYRNTIDTNYFFENDEPIAKYNFHILDLMMKVQEPHRKLFGSF